MHQLYGAELVAVDATIVHTTRSTPSAVLLGALPPAHGSTELGRALGTGGRIVYQEHDAVLDNLLAAQETSVPAPKAHDPAHHQDHAAVGTAHLVPKSHSPRERTQD
ncbi:hypothetical protein ABZV29_34505 [Streptomyces sp. NPDC005236]|uniref:hypothetical protein n=1 Tax=Streptomyces sp. NPDC005236 TaxID=3157028 RepID=UPI0033A46A3C